MARIGCLAVVVIVVACAWFTRGKWMPRITSGPPPVVSTAPVWEPLSPQAGARGKRVIESLQSSGGPVFANLRAGEIASYVFATAGQALPASADSVEAAVIGDALCMRAIVPMKEIAGSGALGPLGGLLNEREKLSICGSFHVVHPGLSEFQVREIKLREIKVPSGAIPRLLEQLSKGKRPAGIAADALPVVTPKSLADVRIANHQVTLYRTTPGAKP